MQSKCMPSRLVNVISSLEATASLLKQKYLWLLIVLMIIVKSEKSKCLSPISHVFCYFFGNNLSGLIFIELGAGSLILQLYRFF